MYGSMYGCMAVWLYSSRELYGSERMVAKVVYVLRMSYVGIQRENRKENVKRSRTMSTINNDVFNILLWLFAVLRVRS